MSDQGFLDELKSYVGFAAEHAQVLGEIRPELEPAFPGIVESFYVAIQQHPRALAVFTGGAAQIERQKGMLTSWLEGLLGGVYDLAYLSLRERIGRTHVRIQLDQRYMFTAMNLVREGLHGALRSSAWAEARRALAHTALDKICDLELAIMLQTYAEDSAARLRDNERLATLGQLAGFVGHELRNPLAVMETSLHLLRKRLPQEDENVQRHTHRLAEQLNLSASIIAALLELARDRPVERVSVPIRPLLEDALKELPMPDHTVPTVHVPSEDFHAKLDPKQVRQLVKNLVTNAAQALAQVPEHAARRIDVRAERAHDALVVTVDDTGPGVAEDLKSRLFEPLATNREKGLGLGLALCRRIAEKHGGEIRAARSPLGGARFLVRLANAFEETP